MYFYQGEKGIQGASPSIIPLPTKVTLLKDANTHQYKASFLFKNGKEVSILQANPSLWIPVLNLYVSGNLTVSGAFTYADNVQFYFGQIGAANTNVTLTNVQNLIPKSMTIGVLQYTGPSPLTLGTIYSQRATANAAYINTLRSYSTGDGYIQVYKNVQIQVGDNTNLRLSITLVGYGANYLNTKSMTTTSVSFTTLSLGSLITQGITGVQSISPAVAGNPILFARTSGALTVVVHGNLSNTGALTCNLCLAGRYVVAGACSFPNSTITFTSLTATTYSKLNILAVCTLQGNYSVTSCNINNLSYTTTNANISLPQKLTATSALCYGDITVSGNFTLPASFSPSEIGGPITYTSWKYQPVIPVNDASIHRPYLLQIYNDSDIQTKSYIVPSGTVQLVWTTARPIVYQTVIAGIANDPVNLENFPASYLGIYLSAVQSMYVIPRYSYDNSTSYISANYGVTTNIVVPINPPNTTPSVVTWIGPSDFNANTKNGNTINDTKVVVVLPDFSSTGQDFTCEIRTLSNRELSLLGEVPVRITNNNLYTPGTLVSYSSPSYFRLMYCFSLNQWIVLHSVYPGGSITTRTFLGYTTF